MNHTAGLIETAGDLEMPEFITERVYEYFRVRQRLSLFLEILFNLVKRPFTLLMPEAFYADFFAVYRDEGRLADVEGMLLSKGIPEHLAPWSWRSRGRTIWPT